MYAPPANRIEGREPVNPDSSETILVCEVCGARNRILAQNTGRHYVCGKCQNPLREFSAGSQECLICGDETGNEDEFLSNGSTYHQLCYEETLQETRSLEQQRTARREEISRISRRIRTERSLLARMGRFFSGDESKVPQLRAQILQLETEVQRLGSEKDQCSEFLKGLYDHWLTYPPDWNERRKQVLRYAQACENCGSHRGPLHIHHEVPISKGGSHSLDNLCVLCERCHERQHGDRPFQYTDDAQAGPFEKRLRILREAISGGKLYSSRMMGDTLR